MDSPSSVRSSPAKAFRSPLSSPTKALNPLSSERMNKQSIHGSPSQHSDIFTSPRKNTRGLSDVQSKVAFLNNLARNGSPVSSQHATQSTSAASSAALQRAILGREEAESALANVTAELSEAQSRERRISERLESLLEELQSAKERQGHERSVFEKEIRKARKEAFRASSHLVKLQEELRHHKSESKGLKEELRAEKEAKEQAKQEAFERAYALAGLMEEVEVLKEQLRAAETNKRSDGLEVEAKAINTKDVGRLSLAEGDLALLATPRPPKRPAEEPAKSSVEDATNTDPVKATPPKRIRLSDIQKEGFWADDAEVTRQLSEVDTLQEKLEELEELLEHEKSVRQDAEDMVTYMKWECSIRWCQCRVEEAKAKKSLAKKLAAKSGRPKIDPTADDRARTVPTTEAASNPAEKPHGTRVHETTSTEGLGANSNNATQVGSKPDSDRPGLPPQAKTPEANKSERKQHKVRDIPKQQTAPIEPKEVAQHRVENPAPVQMEVKQSHSLPEVHHDRPQQIEPVKEEPELEDDRRFINDEVLVEEEEAVNEEDEEDEGEPMITFSPATGTFHTIPSPIRSPRKHPQEILLTEPEAHQSPTPVAARKSAELPVNDVPFNPCDPQPHNSPAPIDVPWDSPLPKQQSNRAQPTLESREFRIPLRNDPAPQQNKPPVSEASINAPINAPINREEALAQIRARRGRTNTMKRSVSANESTFRSGGMGVTPVRTARRIPGVQNAQKSNSDVRSRRDLSAPVRMFHR